KIMKRRRHIDARGPWPYRRGSLEAKLFRSEQLNAARPHDFDAAEVQDGEGARVRLDICDSMQRDAARRYHRTAIADAVDEDCALWTGHRNGYPNVRWNTRDAARMYALLEARDQAFRDLEERSCNAWRNGPAVAPPLNAMPRENYDQEKPLRDPDEDGDEDADGNGDDLQAATA